MNSTLRILILLLCCSCLSACVTGAKSRAMVPADFSLGKQFNKSVGIAVTGGQKTNPLWMSMVSNEDFADALQKTIEQHGLFSRVLRSGGADYQLDVRLVQLRQPMFGFNMTVQGEIEWRLRQVSTGKVVWEKHTNKSYTATVGQAFAGVTRVRVANEGAIRENIKAALEQIAALSL